MDRWITLRLEVAKDTSYEDVVTYLNCEALCAMEEDEKMITHWEWSELEDANV